jgi:hypothetical protein
MKRMLITLLCAVLLVSCATPAIDYSKSPNVIASNAEYWAARGVEYPPTPSVPTSRTLPPSTPGVSGWDVLGAIVAIPLLIPIAMITSYPGPGVHCRSWTYKDQYHASCY